MSTLVMKFGGSSVGTTAALTQVLSIVLHQQKHWDRLVLIVSALEGVTDMLLEAAHLAQIANQRGYRRIAATLRTRHMALVENLPLGPTERGTLQADIDQLLFEMLDLCQSIANTPSDHLSPASSDRIAGVGERLSARIIAALLRQNDLRGVAIDGMELIVTDSVHGNATPLLEPTRSRIQQHLIPMLERKIIPVVTGFIGADAQGRATTLGRGGSDYTASILAVCTGAREVWIWSNVDGMMTADPREISDARPIDEMSYSEVAELAYFGARILHPRMVRELREASIPLRVKNVFKPQQPGTIIRLPARDMEPRIKAVTAIQGIAVLAPHSGVLTRVTQIADEVLLSQTGSRAEVMISSQASASSFVCFVVPTSTGLEAVDNVCHILQDRLNESTTQASWTAIPLIVITAIGEHLDQMQHLSAAILNQINGIRLYGIAQGPSGCSMSVIVGMDHADEALRRIHALTHH